MGFEYECDLRRQASPELVGFLLDSLARDGRWQATGEGPFEIALQYTGETIDPKWPERILVRVTGSRLYVVFHSGTATQREELLGTIKRVLESTGVSCELSEL
jgi:hypothetical protein